MRPEYVSFAQATPEIEPPVTTFCRSAATLRRVSPVWAKTDVTVIRRMARIAPACRRNVCLFIRVSVCDVIFRTLRPEDMPGPQMDRVRFRTLAGKVGLQPSREWLQP